MSCCGKPICSPAQAALDLGCGTATLTIALKQSCPQTEVFGLDGDEKILELARAKAKKADLEITFEMGLSFEMLTQTDSLIRLFRVCFFII